MSIAGIYRALTNPVAPSTAADVKQAAGIQENKGPSEFQKILSDKQQLNFSQHAETRIKSRAIPWDAGLEKRIQSGLDQAREKGSREALILADNVAVIANVKSRTIITAMDRTQLKEKIFTNIDSAVLV